MSGDDRHAKPDAEALNLDRDVGNFSFAEDYAYDAGVGLNEEARDMRNAGRKLETQEPDRDTIRPCWKRKKTV